MFIKNLYKKRLGISKDQVVDRILNSTEFKVKTTYRYGGLLYESFRTGSFSVEQKDKYYFEFAEYAGTGSITETLGKVDLEDENGNTIVILKLRMSFFPNNISQYIFILSVFVALIDLKLNPSPLCVIFFFIAFGSLVIWFKKFFSTRDVLRRFSKTLGTDRTWKD